ncbi:DUF4214 domain-containing protein [Pseudomonas helleri]|uniref:DUF4214 domain-containing protein n=1 Tax=Pseudomonas helleri TaxID=1608996 RepID=UPI003FD61464
MTESARLVITVDSTQAAKAGTDLSALERQANKTEIGIGSLAKAASAAFGALKLGSVITDAVTLSARYDQLGIVMSRVGQNTGRSTVELAALDQELQKAGISALQSRNNIIKMMSANIDLAQATKLARLAQDAAVIGNTNSSEAFERLIKGIQSAEKETLETLGLNVNFQQSYENLAKQLGKNADQLTASEKTQAGVNAAMEAGKNIAGAYEDSLGNANKALQSTSKYVENLMIKLGAPPQGAFKSAVDSYSEALQTLDKNANVVIQVLETGLSIAIARGVTAVGASAAAFIAETRTKQAAATASLALAQATTVETAANLRATTARHAAFASHVEVTAAANAHAAAELKLAAAQKASSLTSVAAAGAGSRLLGLLGGPWGIALTVGAAALSFLDFGDKAKTGMGAAANATEQAATRIRNATRNMLPGNLESLPYADIQARLVDVGGQLDKAKKELDRFQKSFDSGSISKQWLTEPQERVAALEGAYQKLQEQANGARFASDKAGSTYVESLSRQAALVGKVTEVEKLRANVQAGFIKLSAADLQAAELKAAAIDRSNESMRAGSQLEKESVKDAKAKSAALAELLAQSDITISSTNAMADAYLSGADSVRELSIQQKIEQETLKLGADAHDAVAAAVRKEADAKDRLDITQSIASMRTETTQTLAQATATLQGKDALEAFNIQKSMTVALAGRNIEVGSKEYQLLLDQTKAQLDANKALEQANSIEGIVDRLNPQIKLLRDYTKEQKALNAAIASGIGDTALYQDTLAKLALEYEQNKNAATAWGQFTEGAVDRVDSAFADAWKNIGDGFNGFATSLKDGFKQLLAELAHMAITKPIIMQIGASLGVGGLSAQSSGLFGGSSGGGTDIFSLAKGANQLYSVANSGFGQAISSGWASGDGLFGGLQNAFSGGYGYVGSALGFGSGAAGAAASSGLAQGAAAYGSQFGTGIGTVSFPGAASGAAGGAASGAASAGLSGLGAAGYGIGGAIAGYQQAGVKGAVTGAGGAVAGAYAGAAIGSVVPIIGTAIGAAIGAVLGGMLGSSVWGGDWVTKDQGIQLGVTDNQFVGKQFEYQKKKGGLFSSNKKRTRLSALDPEMQAALDSTYDATEGSVLSLFDRLNVELSDGVLDGLNVASTNISTKGKTGDEIQEAIAKWFGGVADSMVSAVDAATAAGLGGYNFETLTTFVNNLYSVNAAVEKFGVKAVGFNVAGGKAVESLVAVSGGMEALTTGMNDYYAAFTTEMDRSADSLAAARAEFTKFGFTLPGTRDGLKDVVKGLDLTTEIGQNMFSAIVRNAKAAADAYTILEQRESAYRSAFFTEAENTALAIKGTTAELKALGVTLPASRSEYRKMVEEAAKSTTDTGKAMYDTLMNAAGAASTVFDELDRRLNQGVTDSFSGVQRSISAQQKAATAAYNATNTSLSDMSATAVKSVTDLSSVSNSLESALKSLRGTSDDAVKTLRAQAQATLQSALATARSGGSLASFTGLEDALDTVSDNNTDLYGSMEDFARDQGRTANVVAELNAINGKQLTAAEKLQKSIEDQIGVAKQAYDAQMAQFDQQLEFAQAQMDAFNGIDTSVKSVEAAIKALNGSLIASLAAKPATGAGSAVANTAANNATVVDTLYQQLFGRTADAGENKYWADRLGSGNLPYAEIVANMTQYASAADKAAMAAKGYATGGLISGPGTGTSDSILARLSNGEYVISADAVRMFGTGFLDQMNAGLLPAFAIGGGIGESGPQLEVTGPSRIFNANQAGSGRSGGDSGATAAEVRELRREIKDNATYTARLTKTIADGIDTLVNSGVQINGTVETKAVA